MNKFEALDENHIDIIVESFDSGNLGITLKDWNMAREIYFEFDDYTLYKFKRFISELSL